MSAASMTLLSLGRVPTTEVTRAAVNPFWGGGRSELLLTKFSARGAPKAQRIAPEA